MIIALVQASSRLSAWVNARQIRIQVVAGAIALVLGLWGWTVEKPPANATGWLNNIFRTMQLITLQFPSEVGGSIPWQLQIARLALPVVAVLATFNALVVATTRPIRLAMVPGMKGHIIVCGSDHLTLEALRSLAGRKQRILLLSDASDDKRTQSIETSGITLVSFSPFQPGDLTRFNIASAAAFFVAYADDYLNADLAARVLQANVARPASSPPLVLSVLVGDEETGRQLDMIFDDAAGRQSVRYYRMSPDREDLRYHLSKIAPVFSKPDAAGVSHAIVAGLAGTWQQSVMQLVVSCQDHPDLRPVLTFIVNAHEAVALARWRADVPGLALICDFAVLERAADGRVPLMVIEAWRQSTPMPHLAIVLRDGAAAMRAAIELRQPGTLMRTENCPMLLRRAGYEQFLVQMCPPDIDASAGNRIIPFGVNVSAETIERVLDRKGDELATSLHNFYVAHATDVGGASAAVMRPWHALSENVRDANRCVVAHAPVLFASAGMTLQKSAAPSAIELSSIEREWLTRVEHRRWMADRIDRGWKAGRPRDDVLRIHPDLVPFDKLDQVTRDKDENSVLNLIQVLRSVGIEVVRKKDCAD